MASCITSQHGSNTCPQIRLTVTEKSSTNTSVTYEWKLEYVAHGYAVSTSNIKDYSVVIGGVTEKTGTYSIGGRTGVSTIASDTKTINRTHAKQTINFSLSFEWGITWSGVKGAATLTASSSFSVPAKPSYTVSYNANGGSGAPSKQTKWYGEALTLSSTTPTRSGYTFVGWGLTASDTSWTYKAGGTYSNNADISMFALWKKTIRLTYNANGGSGAPSEQSATIWNATTSKSFTVSSTVPTRTGYKFLGWATSASATSASYLAGQTITLSDNGTLYAVWQLITYKVSFNANGGTNAPAAQTKTHGTDLVLTSSKPSRAGYNFKGWATSASGGVAYNSGATYSTNANITLYAVWESGTYTVSYNANGGSGAPGSQTKTHGTNLTLSSTEPTRKYYKFLGWAESSTATVATYSKGGTYSKNSSVTLYAVWEVAYTAPRIANVTVTRCNSSGTPTDDGTYAKVNFDWSTDENVTGIKIYWKKTTDGSYGSNASVSASGKSGSVSQIVGGGGLNAELAYNFRIDVTDSGNSSQTLYTLHAMVFPLDFLKNGKGVAIGGPATETGVHVKDYSTFHFLATFSNGARFNNITESNNYLYANEIFMRNNKSLYGQYTDDAYRLAITCCDNYNNLQIGYGSYAGKIGGTQVMGNKVSITSNEGVDIDGMTYGENRILWEGVNQMGNTRIHFTGGTVSAQPHGIVLAWSLYSNGAAKDSDWHYIFVPKEHITSQEGDDVTCLLASSRAIVRKSVYVNDDYILGVTTNTSTSQSFHGQSVDNTTFVLRKVIGV